MRWLETAEFACWTVLGKIYSFAHIKRNRFLIVQTSFNGSHLSLESFTVYFLNCYILLECLYQVRTTFRHNRWSGCSASRIKPNETFEFAKKRQNMLCFGGGGRKNFFTLWPSYKQSPKIREKSPCPAVLQLRLAHLDMARWKYDSLCIFSMSWGTLELILWKKADKNGKIRKGAFFREGCFDRKEYVSNTANKRCSRQVLQLRCSSWYFIKFYT